MAATIPQTEQTSMSVRQPVQGETVIFIPRVPQGRQPELTALISRVWDAEKGDIDIAYLRGHEWVFMEHVAPMDERVQLHCWSFPRGDQNSRIAALEEAVAVLQADMRRMVQEVRGLKGGAAPAAVPARVAAGKRGR